MHIQEQISFPLRLKAITKASWSLRAILLGEAEMQEAIFGFFFSPAPQGGARVQGTALRLAGLASLEKIEGKKDSLIWGGLHRGWG